MYCRSVRWNCIYLYQKVSKLIFKKIAPRFYQSISIRQERKETKVFLNNFARKGVHWVMPGGCFVEKSKQSDIMITDAGKRCFINRSYMITLEYYYLNIRKRKKKEWNLYCLTNTSAPKKVLSSEILENFVDFADGGNHINDREKLNWITKPITYLIYFVRTFNLKKRFF